MVQIWYVPGIYRRLSARLTSQTVAEITAHVTVYISLFYIGALVVLFFPLAQTEFDLYKPVFQVHSEGDQGIPLFPDAAVDALYFRGVEEELLFPVRIMLEHRRKRILGDMKIPQPDFSSGYFCEGVGEGNPPVLDGFYFGAEEADAALEAFVDVVVEPRSSIERHDL